MTKTVPLDEGAVLVTKQMVGTDGTAFPKHTASLESALLVLEGSCTITFPEAVHQLAAGDTFVVPADEVHQAAGSPDFKEIRLDFRVRTR